MVNRPMVPGNSIRIMRGTLKGDKGIYMGLERIRRASLNAFIISSGSDQDKRPINTHPTAPGPPVDAGMCIPG